MPASLMICHTVETATLHPENEEFAVHSAVAPSGVLPDQSQHQDAGGTHGLHREGDPECGCVDHGPPVWNPEGMKRTGIDFVVRP